jgi:NAD(P)-dependent dehydrogenase (short-subunit alcohol dehydrogenase family)
MSSADVLMELKDRVVLISGAARGQGRAIAERAVKAGALVIAGDILESVAELGEASPNQVLTGTLDITDAESWERLVKLGIERFGHLDALVNNAGILHRASVASETAEQFEHLWRVNCLGAFLGIQAVLPELRKAGGGTIINTLSTAAMSAWSGHGSYASSKWALRGLTKVTALELAGEGIRVNAIVPGPVLTPMVLRPDDPEGPNRLAGTPLGRAGVPSDIAELALFLLSDRSSFITGAELVIDGGQTAGIMMREHQ